jgi:hypothetical protein
VTPETTTPEAGNFGGHDDQGMVPRIIQTPTDEIELLGRKLGYRWTPTGWRRIWWRRALAWVRWRFLWRPL